MSKSVESARVFRQGEDTRNLHRSGVVNLGRGLRDRLTEPNFERPDELKSNVIIKDNRLKYDIVSLIPGSVFTSLEVQVNDLTGSDEVDEEGLLEPGMVDKQDWEQEELSLYEDGGDGPVSDQNSAMPRGVIGNFGFKSQFNPLKTESEFQSFLDKMKRIYWWHNPDHSKRTDKADCFNNPVSGKCQRFNETNSKHQHFRWTNEKITKQRKEISIDSLIDERLRITRYGTKDFELFDAEFLELGFRLLSDYVLKQYTHIAKRDSLPRSVEEEREYDDDSFEWNRYLHQKKPRSVFKPHIEKKWFPRGGDRRAWQPPRNVGNYVFHYWKEPEPKWIVNSRKIDGKTLRTESFKIYRRWQPEKKRFCLKCFCEKSEYILHSRRPIETVELGEFSGGILVTTKKELREDLKEACQEPKWTDCPFCSVWIQLTDWSSHGSICPKWGGLKQIGGKQ